MTDHQGEGYEHFTYTPYGEVWVEEHLSSKIHRMSHRFTGQELDPETGLYAFPARNYDPRTSRWLSADPALKEYLPEPGQAQNELPAGGAFNPTNFTAYHYTNNNPLKYVDPAGEFPVAAALAALAFTLTLAGSTLPEQAPTPLASVPTSQLADQFAGKFGHPSTQAGPVLQDANNPPRFRTETFKGEYSSAARVVQGLLPVGVDDAYGPAALHSMADAIGGGWGQVRLTTYTDQGRNNIVGWEIEQYLPDTKSEGPAGGQPDFVWTTITNPEDAMALLEMNPELMAEALTRELRPSAIEGIIKE